MKSTETKSLFLIGLGLLIPALAARATRVVAGKGYEMVTHHEPPKNPANPEVEWKEALAWAAVSGLIGGMTRLVARRWLAETFVPAEGDDMEDEVEKIA